MTPRDNCNRAIHPNAPLAGNCPHCARAHALQRAEDEALVSARRGVEVSRAQGRINGPRYGAKRVRPPLPDNPTRTHCKRGHPFRANLTRSRDCLACARERNAAAGKCVPLAAPVRCTVCGVEFLRTATGQKRCDAHARRNQRPKTERKATVTQPPRIVAAPAPKPERVVTVRQQKPRTPWSWRAMPVYGAEPIDLGAMFGTGAA